MYAQPQTSRRLFLAAGSASAVFGALAQAAAASATADDPIFAAIERHKAAEVRFNAACGLTDEMAARNERRIITTADHAEFEAAERGCDEAVDAFLTTVPTTIAGVGACLRHCVDEESIGQFIDEALETLLRSPVLSDLEARS